MMSPPRTAEPDAPDQDAACPSAPPPEITIDPSAREWKELLEQSRSRPDADRRRHFREQLGLPIDAPIIMTGHQVFLWHAGILAKFLAADRAASALDAKPAWLVVDQDEHEYATIRAPIKEPAGAITPAELHLLPQDAIPPLAIPSGLCPSFEPSPLPDAAFACDSVRAGLQRAWRTLTAHADEPDASRQLAAALRDLMRPLIDPARTIFATALSDTDLFGELVSRMRDDPRRAAESYNAAVRAVPASGVAELSTPNNEARVELPLWRLRKGEPRKRVFAESLREADLSELAPRALVLTGLMRLAGCDLFIHGLGGAAYDAVTERWLDDWLGVSLAPAAVVSATLRLPLAPEGADESSVNQAVWRAHAAKHNPDLLNDSDPALEDLAKEKRRLVERIDQQREARRDASADFHALHDLLARYRRDYSTELERLERSVHQAKRTASAAELAQNRTWPFVCHSEEALDALLERFDEAFG